MTVQFTFTFIELTSSVPLAELLVETFRQSVEHGPLKGSEKPPLKGDSLRLYSMRFCPFAQVLYSRIGAL